MLHSISSVQSLSHVWLFAAPWTAVHEAFLFITNFQSLFKLMSIESVIHPTISSSVVLFSSHLQSFPASGSFPMGQFFSSSSQSIGISASVLPVNSQGWFPLGLPGLNFLLSRGLSRVFFSITIQKHQFFGTQPSLWSLASIHDSWKHHSFN